MAVSKKENRADLPCVHIFLAATIIVKVQSSGSSSRGANQILVLLFENVSQGHNWRAYISESGKYAFHLASKVQAGHVCGGDEYCLLGCFEL